MSLPWSLLLGRNRLVCHSLLAGSSSDAQCPAALLDVGTAGWGCLSQQGHQGSLILPPSVSAEQAEAPQERSACPLAAGTFEGIETGGSAAGVMD